MILIWTPSYLSESPSSCTIRIVPLAAAGAAPTAIKASRARDPAAAFSLSEYDRMRFPLCRGLKFTTLGGPKQCQGCSGQIFSARPGYPAPRQSRPKCGPVREFGVIFSCPESSALYRCGRAARPVEWNHETAQDWDRWLRRRTSDRRRRTRRRLYARQFPCKRQGRTLRRRAARAREGPNTHRVRTLVLPQCHALALRTTRYDRRARRQRVAARFGHPQRRCRMASEKRAACTARRLGVHGRLRIGGFGSDRREGRHHALALRPGRCRTLEARSDEPRCDLYQRWKILHVRGGHGRHRSLPRAYRRGSRTRTFLAGGTRDGRLSQTLRRPDAVLAAAAAANSSARSIRRHRGVDSRTSR